ncbi:protein jag [Aerococcaceae bacterium zg-BR22]|uniref:RNA-binding cell elongation regulator Jag/EloR n=1 Tax=Aerococcaceae bacterium zg-1292 TaxID=2774330 RepID=UPI0040631EAC|nr:protein jag [Aerococcaceae bacterium zg-BR22]
MEQSTTVRAETVEKAVKIALTKLNITRDEAQINVISEGKKGLFGFGKQDAIVEVSANQKIDISILETVMDEPTIEVTKPEVTVQSEAVEEDSLVEEDVVVPVEMIEVAEQEATAETVEQPTTAETKTESETEIDLAAKHELVARYLEDVIRAYGADSTIEVENKRNQLIFNIQTEKSGLIIGKHGKIINALQVLAQVKVHQYDRRRQSIILNIGDYRDRRATVLEQIAERTAKEVLRTKQSVVLDPLPSYERKQIHAYLSKVDHIETHSEGRDPNRYLVVEYKA